MPAATIGRTETPPRSASSVTNASCSTWRRRLNPRLGRSPRFHREPQSEARNWPSHASRPYTLTRSCFPSGETASTSATPVGSSGACLRSVASTPRSPQRCCDLVQRKASGGRAEHQVQDRARPEADQEPGHHPDGQRDAERDAGDRADRHDPAADEPDRAAHVRRGHHDDRGGDREPDREVDGGASDAAMPRRLDGQSVPATSPASKDRPSARAPASELRQEQPLPPARDEREEQQEESPSEQQVVRDLPEPPEEPGSS